jgi:hypothetical protein
MEYDRKVPCYGCLTLLKYSCKYYIYNINGKCPCTACIIKMICCDECDEFIEWEDKRKE